MECPHPLELGPGFQSQAQARLLTERADVGLPVCPQVFPHVQRVKKVISILFMYRLDSCGDTMKKSVIHLRISLIQYD